MIRLITAIALAAGVAAAPNLAGRWTLSVKSPHGDMSTTMVLKQDGKKITGTFENPHGGGDRPVAGEFADGTLKIATTDGDESSTTSFNAKLKDDGTLAGYVSSPMGDMTFTAARIKN